MHPFCLEILIVLGINFEQSKQVSAVFIKNIFSKCSETYIKDQWSKHCYVIFYFLIIFFCLRNLLQQLASLLEVLRRIFGQL